MCYSNSMTLIECFQLTSQVLLKIGIVFVLPMICLTAIGVFAIIMVDFIKD
jgi:hypothetical protein